MSDNLRSRVIRLAHAQPELRPHLLPLLKTAGFLGAVNRAVDAWRRKHGLPPGPPVEQRGTESLVMEFEWYGSEAKLRPLIERGQYPLNTYVMEALDSSEWVAEAPSITVEGTGARVVYPLRPYDPDEDSAF